jgi:hypothetical protein
VRLATSIVLGLCLASAGCAEKDEPEVSAPPEPPAAATTTGADDGAETDSGQPSGGDREGAEPPDRAAARRRAVERVVRDHVEALDRRDGAAVCRLLAPGALDDVRVPRERGSCAASLDASIGYRDPRGLPQFEGLRLARIVSVQADPRSARVTATVVTEFADRDEPSIEDDIVYLTRRRGEWLLAKPDAALYRAIGAEPALESIVPPG